MISLTLVGSEHGVDLRFLFFPLSCALLNSVSERLQCLGIDLERCPFTIVPFQNRQKFRLDVLAILPVFEEPVLENIDFEPCEPDVQFNIAGQPRRSEI